MTYQEIKDLINLVKRAKLSEFKMKQGDFELAIRTEHYLKDKGKTTIIPAASPMVSVPAHQALPAEQEVAPSSVSESNEANGGTEKSAETSSDLLEVKSPMVGTFYRSPAPEKGPYVKVGDHIEVGSVVCIVEAMKLFNEIESEVSGKIVKMVVEDASPVEYDQVLFLVEPS
jgi:acetyl-CoA carboxylase biotin carboxyl carrier protein